MTRNLQSGFIAIKNISFDDLGEVFLKFRLKDTKNDKPLNSFQLAEEIIENKVIDPGDYKQRRIVWAKNDWLIIEDISFLLCTNEKAIRKIASDFNTEVFAQTTYDANSSYCFIHANGDHFRYFKVKNGKIEKNIGKPSEEETQFQTNDLTSHEYLNAMFKKLGIDWETVSKITDFTVKELENTEELNQEIMKMRAVSEPEEVQNQKPWWKFW